MISKLIYILSNVFISANALRCHFGSSSGYIDEIECSSTLDRCMKSTVNGVVAYACSSASILTASGARDNSCTTIGSDEVCICSTDGCNKNTVGKCYKSKEYSSI